MTGTCTVGSGGVALACSSLFYFSVPALLGIVFLSCKVVEIVKVGSSTLLGKLSFRYGFVLVFESIHVAWLVYVRTCWVPIATLNQNKRSGRRPNND